MHILVERVILNLGPVLISIVSQLAKELEDRKEIIAPSSLSIIIQFSKSKVRHNGVKVSN